MVNKVILIGRLTKDIELKKTNSGLSVTDFSLAVNRIKRPNEEQKADFINVQAWRQTAEFLNTYAKKGNLVYVEGRMQVDSYQTQEGINKIVVRVVADRIQLLSKNENNQKRDEKDLAGTYNDHYNKQPIVGYEEEVTDYTLDIDSDDLPF